MTLSQKLAETVRVACIKAALDAYEEGGILGLCAEGRWEYANSDVATTGFGDANSRLLNGLTKETKKDSYWLFLIAAAICATNPADCHKAPRSRSE